MSLLLAYQENRASDESSFIGTAGYVIGSTIAGAALIGLGYLSLRTQEALSIRSEERGKAQKELTKVRSNYLKSSGHTKLVESIEKFSASLEKTSNIALVQESIPSDNVQMLLNYTKNPTNILDADFCELDPEDLKSVLLESATFDESLSEDTRKEVVQLANDLADVIRKAHAVQASQKEFIKNIETADKKYSEESGFSKHYQKSDQAPSDEVSKKKGLGEPFLVSTLAVGTFVGAVVADKIISELGKK